MVADDGTFKSLVGGSGAYDFAGSGGWRNPAKQDFAEVTGDVRTVLIGLGVLHRTLTPWEGAP